MPRRPTVLQSDCPYFITARCINKEWFRIPMDEVWDIMCRQLYFMHRAYSVLIHAFVLMSNHYHAIISTPEANISTAMWDFSGQTSRFLTQAGNRINQTYCGRYHKSLLDSHHSFLNAYKYLYYNPVKAGICQSVEEYRYSTLHGLLGQSHLFAPLVDDGQILNELESTLYWLNQEPNSEHWDHMGEGLKRAQFRLRRDPNTKRAHPLETEYL